MTERSLAGRLAAPFDRFYPTAKPLFMMRMARRTSGFARDPIVLLQLGKVGSTSVFAGLEATVTDRPIYHLHFLSENRLAEAEQKRRKFFRTRRHPYLVKIWRAQFLKHAVESGRGNDYKLISITREPIGRNISAFFQNLEVTKLGEDLYEISSDYYDIEPTQVSTRDTDKLAELFYQRSTHDSALHFFDREIRQFFGIDVYAHGFDLGRGYQIYSGDRAQLLVMRLEDIADIVASAMQEFLGIDDFRLINRNIGAEKPYAPLYKAFKRNVLIDADYADTLLNSEYTRTFYSSREIEEARERWVGRPVEAAARSAS